MVIVLHRIGPFGQRISVARRLCAAGSRLTEAHRAITRLAADDWATCPVASDADLKTLAEDLAQLDVEVRVHRRSEDPAGEAVRLRKAKALSQSEYAALLNVDVRTLQNWEQGRNQPDSATLNLMRAFARAPDVVEEAISEPVLG